MRIFFLATILLSFIDLSAQKDIDAYKLPQVNFAPQIYVNGMRQGDVISLKSLREYGLQIVLDDKSFKAIQFDFGFDCHSGSFFDFNWKRYYGDKVLPLDVKMKSWVWVGDIIVISGVVITKGKEYYVMKDKGLRVID